MKSNITNIFNVELSVDDVKSMLKETLSEYQDIQVPDNAVFSFNVDGSISINADNSKLS